MSIDWHDALAKLSSELPEGTEPAESPAKKAKRGVTLFFEKKGRGGKTVTILADFEGVTDNEIEGLASELKRALGTGGSVRGGEILIQGDRREQVRVLLKQRNYKVKG